MTTLGAETSWLGPRWQLTGSAGFSVSGGLDGPAREAVPLQYGPRLSAALGYLLGPLDTLSTAASLSDSRFSTGSHATVTTFTQGWTHRVSRFTSLEMGGGIGVAYSQDAPPEDDTAPGVPPRLEVLPDATLALGHRIPSRVLDFNGRLSAHLTPFVDRLTGRVYPRTDLTLSGTWALGPRVRVTGTGGAAFAVGGAVGDRVVTGGVGAGWMLTRWISLEADTRSTWSRSPEVETTRFQWAVSLGVSIRQTGML